MSVHSRLTHAKQITRWGWVVIYEIGWGALFINADFIIEKYGTESQKTYWEHITHPNWGWKSWAIGALIIFILFVIEGSYRLERERKEAQQKKEAELSFEITSLKQKLARALDNPSGPELVIERTEPNTLTIRNTKGGTAHNVRVGPIRNGNCWCLHEDFSFIEEGKYRSYTPMIASDPGHIYADPHRFEDFLTCADRGKPLEEKTLCANIPIPVTYWDGAHKDFTCEYEMSYRIITSEFTVTLKSRTATLRLQS